MTNHPERQLTVCHTLLQLQKEIRTCQSQDELAFLMVNRTLALLPASTNLFWQGGPGEKGGISQAAGITEIDPNAPFILWAGPIMAQWVETEGGGQVVRVDQTTEGLPDRQAWAEWLPPHGLWIPLSTPDGGGLGGWWMVREEPWSERELILAQELGEMFGHGWMALADRGSSSGSPQKKAVRRKAALLLLLATALFLLPIRQSVLAPATVVAHNPTVITAPLDGVIKKIEVEPNAAVVDNQILFSMEQSEIANRRDVTKLALQVAQERYLNAQKVAFHDPQAKATLTLLQSQMAQHAAESAYAESLLERTTIRAKKGGIALLNNPKEWQGRPVSVGEQVMVIADEQQVELEILLAVEDAVIMEPGREVLLFLNSDPLTPLKARLHHASYEATIRPNDQLAYRLIALFAENHPPPRIGLKGTAKLLGEQTTLFYYLFRRPLTAVRQGVGF
ncbi:MAG: HlyD family efflux transporter periplasmic adaptor subunit [Magnetococcales bacterium]|nr:HlyD family efflux transporter periplasmic adaptor subunit [Magnetococcales bacterium]